MSTITGDVAARPCEISAYFMWIPGCGWVPPEMQAEIDALATSEEPIRTDLIPEANGDWSNARRGVFYRPINF